MKWKWEKNLVLFPLLLYNILKTTKGKMVWNL